MTTITLRNDFHNTSARCRPGGIIPVFGPGMGTLSVRQVRRVREKLCGHKDCTCGGDLGTRGTQDYDLVPNADGTVDVYRRDTH